MACRFTYRGKVYDEDGLAKALAAMPLEDASKFIPGVRSLPDAPFVGSTEAWAGIAFKRMIRWGAENGFDEVAWTPGDVQAARYDLSKVMSKLEYIKEDGGYSFTAYDHQNGQIYRERNIAPEKLADYFGKDIADRMIKNEGDRDYPKLPDARTLRGLDLKVGGEGMKGFYDKILPSVANKLGKKFGAKVGTDEIDAASHEGPASWTSVGTSVHRPGSAQQKIWVLPITPAMREAAMQGQPLFRSEPESRQVKLSPEKRAVIEKQASAILTRIAGRGVRVRFEETIPIESALPSGQVQQLREAAKSRGKELRPTIGGFYQFPPEPLVAIALNDPAYEPRTTAGHEAWHHVEAALLNRAERAVLARDMPLMEKMAAEEMAVSVEQVRKQPREEITATAFQRYRRMKEEGARLAVFPGPVRTIFQKIHDALLKVRDMLRRNGVQRFEDVFEAARTGKIAARDEIGQQPASFMQRLAQAGWHGGPHVFDKFSLEHVGTGEGAQAYGWGLYFSGKKEIAHFYRQKLAGDQFNIILSGKDIGPSFRSGDVSSPAAVAAFDAVKDRVAAGTPGWITKAAAAHVLMEKATFPDIKIVPGEIVKRIAPANEGTDEYRRLKEVVTAVDAALSDVSVKYPGALYHVDLPEDDTMLLWDKPLLEQPPQVKEAFEKKWGRVMDAGDLGMRRGMKGAEAYQFLARPPHGPEGASKHLNEMGISGIKYLDGSSRNRPLKDIKREFLAELPQDAETEEVTDLFGTGTFSAKNEALLKALDADDWLGFDYPAQAISAALGKDLSSYDPSPALLKAVSDAQEGGTHNYVVFDDNAVKVIERLASSSDAPLDPFAKDGAAARKDAMVKGFEFQPIDRMLRLPFDIFGGMNAKGEWKPGLYLSKKASRLITTARFDDKARFAFMNPILHHARAGLVDRYGLNDEYVARDRKRQLEERAILSEVPELMKMMDDRGMGATEAKTLHSMLVGEAVPTAEFEKLSEPIRNAVDTFGAEMVELGLISPESFERNRGAYLHRVYLKHENDQGSLGRWVAGMMGSRRRKLIGEELKGRGLWKTVPLDKLPVDVPPKPGDKFLIFDKEGIDKNGKTTIRRTYAKFGTPTPEGTVSRGAWEVRGTKSGEIVLWRDYTKDERTKMGEITDARYTIAKTYMLAAHDLAVGRFYRDLSKNADWTSPTEPKERWVEADAFSRVANASDLEWVHVPDTMIPKSQAKRYGALAGKWIRAEIWRDLNEVEVLNRANIWQKLLTQWKTMKTARSPVVHMNNILSNFMLMDMSGVGMSDLAAGLRSLIKKDAVYEEANAAGAFGVDMVSQEVRQNVLEPILADLEKSLTGGVGKIESRLGALGRLADGIWGIAKAADRKMLQAYQLEDEVFRMALFHRRRAQGVEAQDAADEARTQFIDYDIRAPWVNAARRSFLPFISYTYRAAPLMAKTMATRPWKVAKYAAIAYAVGALSQLLAPGDEDEERRSMREEEQGHTWIGAPRMIRMPWADEHGNPVYLDIRRWIPAGDIFDMNQSNSALPVPAPLQFGGPLMLGAEFAMNKQAFTGKEIVNELTDDMWERTAKTADWFWKSWMPSAAWVPGSWYWNKIGNAVKGARDWSGKPYDVAQAAASSVGVKLNPVDVKENFAYRAIEFDKVERELKFQISRLGRDYARGLLSKDEAESERNKIINKLMTLNRRRTETFTGKRELEQVDGAGHS